MGGRPESSGHRLVGGALRKAHLHCVQVLALEGHLCLVVHGDDQWAGVQELGAAVLLQSEASQVPVGLGREATLPLGARHLSPCEHARCHPQGCLRPPDTGGSAGPTGRSSGYWHRRCTWGRGRQGVWGLRQGQGQGKPGAGGGGHSRQVLRQAHGLAAVVEGVLVGGEEDAAVLEEELDVHSHVVCRWQTGKVSGRSHRASWAWWQWGEGLELGLCQPDSSSGHSAQQATTQSLSQTVQGPGVGGAH